MVDEPRKPQPGDDDYVGYKHAPKKTASRQANPEIPAAGQRRRSRRPRRPFTSAK